jgi:hypothetical protein
MCVNCYNINLRSNGTIRDRKRLDNCSVCERLIGSLDEGGRVIDRGNAKMCKYCYQKDYNGRLSDTCSKCNIKLSRKTARGFCKFCKKEEMDKELELRRGRSKTYIKNKKKKEMPSIPLTWHQREEIRRLLTIYKMGYQTLVEPFRLVSLYVELYSDMELDSYTEESQVIICLRTFKKLFDEPFNIQKDVEEKKNKTADKKEYMKEYMRNYNRERYIREYKKSKK